MKYIIIALKWIVQLSLEKMDYFSVKTIFHKS